MSLTQLLKNEAKRQGFTLVGSCPAVTPNGIHKFHEWLDAGYGGQMTYLRERAEAYEHPSGVLPGARSLVMLALNYRSNEMPSVRAGEGKVSRYAWGNGDYHDVIHVKLRSLVRLIRQQVPGSSARGVVDTAPLLEREFAQLAGLGWLAKNTLVIHPELGSYFFLAAVLTDVVLEYDEAFGVDHCGTCRACLDACPTGAFPQPYVLDATRCISYLTIELRDMLPLTLRQDVGDWVFGCDICQEVCPWNRKGPRTDDDRFAASERFTPLVLTDLFALDDATFRSLFRHTPLWRAKRRGLLRNAAIVLGNQANPGAGPSLTRGLGDPEPIVRAACVWALRQLSPRSSEISRQLSALRKHEEDLVVLEELDR